MHKHNRLKQNNETEISKWFKKYAFQNLEKDCRTLKKEKKKSGKTNTLTCGTSTLTHSQSFLN